MRRVKNEDAIKIQKQMLKWTGIWPDQKAQLSYKLWCLLNYSIGFTNVVILLHSVFVISDSSQIIQNVTFLLGFATSHIKTVIFFCKRATFLKLFTFLQQPIFCGYHSDFDDILKHAIKTSRAVILVFQVLVAAIILFTALIPVFTAKEPLEYGVDLSRKPKIFYVIVYLFQLFALLHGACSTVGIDGLPCGLMALAGAHFHILRESIIQTTAAIPKADHNGYYGKLDEEVGKKLNTCVEVHLAVINFAETIEDIFTFSFLMQFLVSAVSMCMAGVMFILKSPGSIEFVMSFCFLWGLMFQISLYCAYGDEVAYQSLKVGDGCYMTEWVYCRPAVRKSLFVIMERSKRPTVLTAGKFVTLSLSHLVSIVNSAVSYGTIMWQFYSKK